MWKPTIKGSIRASNGVECSSELVFVSALRFAKEKAMEEVGRNFKTISVKLEDIQWVLTVPAVWKDKAKAKMKLWAAKAGLIYTGPKEIPNHLLLVNESVNCVIHAINCSFFQS